MNKQTFNKIRNIFPKNLWQSTLWGDLQEALGKKVYYFGDNDSISLGVIQELKNNITYIDLPRGPIGDPNNNFWDEIKDIAKKNKSIFTRISPPNKNLKTPGFTVKSPDQIYPENTIVLDLILSEEDLLKQMKPKGRYNIRIAQRHNVKVFESKNVEVFHLLLKETTDRDGFSSHPSKYYRMLLDKLGENAKMYLATINDDKDGEKVIAGGIFIFYDDTCTYYYGASSNDYRNYMAPYLIQWTAINEAKKQGLKYYDFLGIAPLNAKRHPLSGVTRFKMQFGGKIKTFPQSKDIVNRPFMYLLYRIYKFIKILFNKLN